MFFDQYFYKIKKMKHNLAAVQTTFYLVPLRSQYVHLQGNQLQMLMYGKVSQENYVELTAASAIPNKEIKSPQILRY